MTALLLFIFRVVVVLFLNILVTITAITGPQTPQHMKCVFLRVLLSGMRLCQALPLSVSAWSSAWGREIAGVGSTEKIVQRTL